MSLPKSGLSWDIVVLVMRDGCIWTYDDHHADMTSAESNQAEQNIPGEHPPGADGEARDRSVPHWPRVDTYCTYTAYLGR